MLGTGRRPYEGVQEVETLYTISVHLNERDIFNTTEPEDRNIYYKIREELKRELDPEDWPSRELSSTPRLADVSFVIYGDLPDYGAGLAIIPSLKDMGFSGMWVSEGSQGASLLIFYPETDAEIVREERMSYRDRLDGIF